MKLLIALVKTYLILAVEIYGFFIFSWKDSLAYTSSNS